jgi:hypothetical protein
MVAWVSGAFLLLVAGLTPLAASAQQEERSVRPSAKTGEGEESTRIEDRTRIQGPGMSRQGAQSSSRTGGPSPPATELIQNADEPKKLIYGVEVYLRGALDGCRAIHETARLPEGPQDRALWREETQRLARELAHADQRLVKLQRSIILSKRGQARPEDVKSNLSAARTQASALQARLGHLDRVAVRERVATIYNELTAGQDALLELGEAFGATPLDRIALPEPQRVRGTRRERSDNPMSAPDRSTDRSDDRTK